MSPNPKIHQTRASVPSKGEPVLVPFAFPDGATFQKARVLLHDAGLLATARESAGTLGSVGVAYGFSQPGGQLVIGQGDLEEADRLLAEHGIPLPPEARPIVDVSDSRCPTCSHRLLVDADPVCGQCGLEFTWVDIGEPEGMLEGVECKTCGYELTANTSKRCPECGSLTPVDLDALVRIATTEDEVSVSAEQQGVQHPINLLAWVIRVVGVALAIVLMSIEHAVAGLFIGVGAVLLGSLLIRR